MGMSGPKTNRGVSTIRLCDEAQIRTRVDWMISDVSHFSMSHRKQPRQCWSSFRTRTWPSLRAAAEAQIETPGHLWREQKMEVHRHFASNLMKLERSFEEEKDKLPKSRCERQLRKNGYITANKRGFNKFLNLVSEYLSKWEIYVLTGGQNGHFSIIKCLTYVQ